MKIIAGIPAFNEEKNIASIITRLSGVVDTILVCDDGSTDLTSEIAKKMGVLVIKHEKNLGYGGAIRSIFLKAKEMDGDILVTFDADGQHRIEDIKNVINPIVKENADLVIGSRFLDDSEKEVPRYRKVGIKVITKITNASINEQLTDSQSGFRAYSKNIIKLIDFKKKGFGADTEILISAAKNGARISEEKVSVIYQTGSQTSTKNPISHSGEVITSLLEIVAIRSPLKFIGIPGIVLIIFGIYFAIDVTLTYNAIGYFSVPFTLIGVSCLVIGLILFLMSILLYSVSKRSKKSKNTY